MSHIIEEYSKALGVRPGKPIIDDHFFPISFGNYITTDFDISGESDTYKYWDIVFNLLNKYYLNLNVVDLSIDRSSTPQYADISIRSDISHRQMSFVISNSSLHLCNNLFSSHLSSYHNVPTVCLFGSLLPNNNKPVFSENVICVSADTDKKPSYSNTDPNNLINQIKPEDIARNCLSLLSIDNDLDNYKTLFIGKYFNSKILEVVPDFKPLQDFDPDKIINIRYDYVKKPEYLEPWLQYKCNIMCDEMLDYEMIKENAHNIAGMTIFLDRDNFTLEYINKIQNLNINFSLICKNKKQIKDQRLKFFDWNVERLQEKKKKDLDLKGKLCHNTFYDSSKELLSEGRSFSSKLHWKSYNNEPSFNKVVDCPTFWEEAEHMNIYNYDRED